MEPGAQFTLYRGEGTHSRPSYYPPKSNMAGGWWTSNLQSAKNYAKSTVDGKVYRIDVDASEAQPRGARNNFFIEDPEVRKRRVEHEDE